ncbi:extensin family protein [Sinorhizobium numidicum]|uniref:Extensin family protein n=1 Tax=Sinorhizobium numidicum TaxID=680248 RepID=A0ABY8D0Z1_9HYPH|nr:extensin family protein [Sinorhizobium numidicum]WEX76554.1 extensin family protein [Sinorhizobium numidicum]WEX83215.1 extensin family protein [Sinorhizobium numidicum]
MRPAAGMMLLSTMILSGVSLPEKGPLPVEKPSTTDEQAPPTPTPKPLAPRASERPASNQGKTGSLGEKKTRQAEDGTALDPDRDGAELREPILRVEEEDPAAHATCLAALKAIGSTYSDAARIDERNGCGIDKPIDITEILPGVSVKPEGKMRCQTALALARWTKETVIPAAQTAFGSEARVAALNQASAYVCRLRNNAETGKISEHARGNAVDIASFTLEGGKTINIQPRDEDGTLAGAFQRAVTATACLYFTTVLDPGSDAAHEDHLHLDVIERKNGYRYCR